MAAYNVNFANATLEGALGGFQLQNHAAGDNARVHKMVDLFAGNGGENFVAIEDAGDIVRYTRWSASMNSAQAAAM